MSNPMDTLRKIRGNATLDCPGLDLATVARFLEQDPRLAQAIGDGEAVLQGPLPGTEDLQKDLLNFYAPDTVNPYVAIGARGPWIVTAAGAVIYDTGGYGMLGFGHGPQGILDILAQPYVMANVMTPSFWHHRFTQAMDRETRNVYDAYVCLNSGSELGALAGRIGDIHSKTEARGRTVKILSLEGSFHGRTERPAQASHSNKTFYEAHLQSFQGAQVLETVKPNDRDGLRRTFQEAKKNNVFFEMAFMEPVMGEGNPGFAIEPEFYRELATLTRAQGGLVLVDSIQAGLRAQGVLSLMSYPGFEDLDPPDMELFSKAINGGQYPVSVMALGPKPKSIYKTGLYGNTMTTSPRGLAVVCQVLESLTPALRANIKTQGTYLLGRFRELQKTFPDLITGVQGTGLLLSIALDPKKIKVVGPLETYLRKNGLGVIHGGENALRFTPVFDITKSEADLILILLDHALREVPAALGVQTQKTGTQAQRAEESPGVSCKESSSCHEAAVF
jgi:acetylornithine/succinyldiaminopimelate/putrescine aminotransferase